MHLAIAQGRNSALDPHEAALDPHEAARMVEYTTATTCPLGGGVRGKDELILNSIFTITSDVWGRRGETESDRKKMVKL